MVLDATGFSPWSVTLQLSAEFIPPAEIRRMNSALSSEVTLHPLKRVASREGPSTWQLTH